MIQRPVYAYVTFIISDKICKVKYVRNILAEVHLFWYFLLFIVRVTSSVKFFMKFQVWNTQHLSIL